MELVCILASHRALFHMKPRGSLTTTVLTEGLTLPEGSADLEIFDQVNRRCILPSERGVIFQEQNAFETFLVISEKWACSTTRKSEFQCSLSVFVCNFFEFRKFQSNMINCSQSFGHLYSGLDVG